MNEEQGETLIELLEKMLKELEAIRRNQESRDIPVHPMGGSQLLDACYGL